MWYFVDYDVCFLVNGCRFIYVRSERISFFFLGEMFFIGKIKKIFVYFIWDFIIKKEGCVFILYGMGFFVGRYLVI